MICVHSKTPAGQAMNWQMNPNTGLSKLPAISYNIGHCNTITLYQNRNNKVQHGMIQTIRPPSSQHDYLSCWRQRDCTWSVYPKCKPTGLWSTILKSWLWHYGLLPSWFNRSQKRPYLQKKVNLHRGLDLKTHSDRSSAIRWWCSPEGHPALFNSPRHHSLQNGRHAIRRPETCDWEPVWKCLLKH